jgi:hypothetical protein
MFVVKKIVIQSLIRKSEQEETFERLGRIMEKAAFEGNRMG